MENNPSKAIMLLVDKSLGEEKCLAMNFTVVLAGSMKNAS
jgi:hypothetical protein